MEVKAVQSLYVCASFFLFVPLWLFLSMNFSYLLMSYTWHNSPQPQFSLRLTTDVEFCGSEFKFSAGASSSQAFPICPIRYSSSYPDILPPTLLMPLDPQCMYGWSFYKLCWGS